MAAKTKAADKYVAYVSTYTQGDSHGIRIYDVDMETDVSRKKTRWRSQIHLISRYHTIANICTPSPISVWKHMRSCRTAI